MKVVKRRYRELENGEEVDGDTDQYLDDDGKWKASCGGITVNRRQVRYRRPVSSIGQDIRVERTPSNFDPRR